MQYRAFGKDRFQVSALGFGTMRLPTREDGHVDEAETIRMLRYGIDHGINYIDTAYPYHDGQSEIVVGKALRDGYREKVLLATKFPTWMAESDSDFDRIFQEQFDRLDVDRIDIYMLHSLGKSFWEQALKFRLLDRIVEKREQGLVDRIGFSFHDDLDTFKEIVDYFDWDFCQIQYNYINETVQAGTAGLKYAAEKGLSVAVMEPLFGGILADPPGAMKEIIDRAGVDPVDLALRWLWNRPEVSLVLSGMSGMEQTVHNIEIAARSGVGDFGRDEERLVEELRQAHARSMPVKCTKCRYCLPCPSGVAIPQCFEYYNEACAAEGNADLLHKNLYMMLPPESRASRCTSCGECEQKCPQKLPIPKHLREVAERFEGPPAA